MQAKLLNSKPTLLLYILFLFLETVFLTLVLPKILLVHHLLPQPTILLIDKESKLIFDSQFGRSQPQTADELFSFVPVRSSHGRGKHGSKSIHSMAMKTEEKPSPTTPSNTGKTSFFQHYLSLLNNTFWDPGFTTHTFGWPSWVETITNMFTVALECLFLLWVQWPGALES